MTILSDFKDRTAAKLIPTQVTLELTYRCNERCTHCYLSTYNDYSENRLPLTLTEWKKILDEFADVGSLLIVFIGGEAMMHPFYWQIAEHAARKNFALTLITNGLLLDDKAADRIADLGFYNVTLSLYSHSAEIHDKMTRRKGSHAKTMEAIERLQKRNVMVGINCLLTESNIDHYFALESWAISKNIEIRFDPLVTAKSNGVLDSTNTRPRIDQLKNFYEQLAAKGRMPTADALQSSHLEDPICNAGRGKCAVNIYGDLLTCLEIRESLGNLKSNSFLELWHSPQAEKIRNRKNKDLKFDITCGDGALCDHCPGMANVETGDPFKPVPYLMEIAKIKASIITPSN